MGMMIWEQDSGPAEDSYARKPWCDASLAPSSTGSSTGSKTGHCRLIKIIDETGSKVNALLETEKNTLKIDHLTVTLCPAPRMIHGN